ncbi:conserved hypothetical protein [Desulfamplus magnetovallimortis]|uniref:PIN domain-containing protein n=1 Tax=Desulfamplus magnetovallimortis TaxID=1246637 RepID=A0A1W1HFE1_9BACT|nr:PhoH family protein [Desulfamplus magnetovallimortis]SLM31095.1 conserved hypothetical protein [Desulfamplus magnetovallimortis]
MKKKFVLDTNVILHDSSCIYQFEQHDIFIPITVIEELDRFKKGKDIINCNARDFLRTLDSLSSDKIFNGGIPIGENRGKISIVIDGEIHDTIKNSFAGGNSDNRILNVAYQLAEKNKDEAQQIVLVSKDVNLRLKARSIGLQTENYQNNYVANLSEINTGIRILEGVESSIIKEMYSEPFHVESMRLNGSNPFMANENLVLKNGSLSVLGVYDKQADTIKRLESRLCYGIKARNAEQIFALNAMLNPDIPLVTISGKAGTGKTLLALAAALEMKKQYRQIFLSRPIVPLSNKDIGFLPGDINSKLDPYMQPLYDNLLVLQNQQNDGNGQNNKIKELIENEKIVITPLSYIRGRSIVRVFFIVDEAQNLTPHEVKTIITRAGEGTKIVFTGDIYQIDHPYLDSQTNGLAYIIDKMKDQPLYAHVNLHKGERSHLSELASRIL